MNKACYHFCILKYIFFSWKENTCEYISVRKYFQHIFQDKLSTSPVFYPITNNGYFFIWEFHFGVEALGVKDSWVLELYFLSSRPKWRGLSENKIVFLFWPKLFFWSIKPYFSFLYFVIVGLDPTIYSGKQTFIFWIIRLSRIMIILQSFLFFFSKVV